MRPPGGTEGEPPRGQREAASKVADCTLAPVAKSAQAPAAAREAWPALLTVAPIARAAGQVALPGSKSISNRVLLLAALALGTSELEHLLEADDTRVMLEALAALGVAIEHCGDRVRIAGCGGRFPNRSAQLFLGNAGTAMRSLAAALAFAGGSYRLDGVARMRERPIGDLVDALNALGARVSYLGRMGFPPLAIEPAQLGAADSVQVRGEVSSQFVSGLLMAAPLIAPAGGLTIEVPGPLISQPYVTMTVRLMARFGVDVAQQDQRFNVPRAAYASPGRLLVEGDASGASYFLALGAIAGGPVRVTGVGRDSVQGDVAFADLLAAMGARVEWGADWIEVSAAGALRAIDYDCTRIPDAAMTAALLGCFAHGRTRLTGIGSWRVKETDRIAALSTELRKLGAQVEDGPDWIAIEGPAALREAVIDTYDDHRIAMCCALAAAAGVPVHIRDPGCVAKTFPDFFSRLASLVAPAPVPVIAIDGPTASGKGTVAQRVSAALGYHYLDSGALYRRVALQSLRAGVAADDAPALAAIAAALRPSWAAGAVGDGEPLDDELRREEVGLVASRIAQHPALRAALLDLQRGFRRAPGLVADGRDMGTVVFPDARTKVFLTASVQARAQRRLKQLSDKGFSANLAALLQDLNERDARDAMRAAAPLRPAEDAKLLDSSALTIDEVVAQVIRWHRGEA